MGCSGREDRADCSRNAARGSSGPLLHFRAGPGHVHPMPTTWITICDTCKRPGWDATGMERTDGEALATLIETEVAGDVTVRTRRVSCTMGCERACNVIVQGEDRIGYSLGTFEPVAEAAEAIAAYARMHAASETGRVPFREWPQGVKGHFVSRHLPVPREPESSGAGPSESDPSAPILTEDP